VACTDFKKYLQELIENAKNDGDDSYSLLNLLVKASASEREDGEQGLSEEELLGNAFIFLVAG
jgi:cytochrome P450